MLTLQVQHDIHLFLDPKSITLFLEKLKKANF